jgi:hypothetical protein
MKSQPPLGNGKKQVLRDKINKFVVKRYVPPVEGNIHSLIKYFAVPKGVINDVIVDWCILFLAGANKLNKCIWAPSFSLPMVHTLLQLVDLYTLMADRDVGEMFHNFKLHQNTVRCGGMDLGLLGYSTDKCTHWWVCWQRNLMGFRSSPYNSVKMYWIAEEVIKGDHHDQKNAFRWDHILLNLPGTTRYYPSKAWILKRRKDGALASNVVTFVDDKRIMAGGEEDLVEAGHTISTKEAYLGIQDALRKVRAHKGSKHPRNQRVH